MGKDLSLALKWLKKAAKQGHALAQSNIGFMYLTGEGVEQSLEIGMKWNRRAAQLGSAPNQLGLGKAYLRGAPGFPQNSTLAASWFRKAAEQGSAEALTQLRRLHESGGGPAWLAPEWIAKTKKRSEEL